MSVIAPAFVNRDFYIVATVRPEAVAAGSDESFEPIFKREPLYVAENNEGDGLPIQYLFRPIPCGIGP